MKRYYFLQAAISIALTGGLSLSGLCQQQPVGNKTIRMSINTEYDDAGKMKRVFWGDHYRKEWATLVELPVLDMDLAAGGLTPVKKGGGFQTKSLRLKGADGKEYVLRSVDKDPSAALPAEFRGTFADDVLQDQISSGHPYAPLAVAPLAVAAGIFHTDPVMVYVPVSVRLGEYNKEFAGTVCLLEERPSDNKNGNPGFGYSKDIVSSATLYEKIFSSSDHRVDERVYLKARLFDILIGDWDRHEDQWMWASFKENGKTTYRPIPRDRDQAFASLDGLIPQLSTQKWALRKIKHFDDEIKDVNGLTMSGAQLDRSFTTMLSKEQWMEVANELQLNLTDKVIEEAVRKMPAPVFDISGADIIAKLKKRRNDLEKYAMQYYAFISQEVNIVGTAKKDIFLAERFNDSTVVSMHTGNQLVYRRAFSNKETNEIRLYGLEGSDDFNISGNVSKGILIRVIGGKDADVVNDGSIVKGMTYKMKIYDEGGNTLNARKARKFISSDTLKNDYNRKGFRFDWFGPLYMPGYNPDDGLYTGGGFTFIKQKFGKAPFGSKHSLWGNYAFSTGAYNFGYKGILTDVVDTWDLHLSAVVNAPNYVRNYYGLGNDTKQSVDDNKYYRLRLDQVVVSSGLYRQFGKEHTLGAGMAYEHIKVERTEGRFISDEKAGLDSAAFGRKYYTAAFVEYEFNTLDNLLFPRNGVRIEAGARYTRNINDSKSYLNLSYTSSFYLSYGRWTAALRSGAATNVNDEYEFFQSNTLGGNKNLRGFRRDRFAGRTSMFNNTEVRFRAKTFKNYLVGGQYGFLAFVDNGRVWTDEHSTTWHYGYGGGVWAILYNRIPITATYGVSKEDNLLTIRAGFLF